MTMSHTEGRLTPDEPTSVVARKSDTESDAVEVDAPTAKLLNLLLPVEPPIDIIISTLFAPELSATAKEVCI